MRIVFLSFLFFMGCVPLRKYEALEAKLGVEMVNRIQMEKHLDDCEERNKLLKDDLEKAVKVKARPMPEPIIKFKKIEKSELEVIKKKALADTERKYQLRTRRNR